MKILRPLGNKIAQKVKSWREIKKEAWELKAFMEAKDFEGHWDDAYAISHVQVSENPKNFFVVHDKIVKDFGSWCVVNLKITKKSDPCTFPEGCMSFMYRDVKRVDRYADIKVFYWTPFMNLFLIPRWKRFKAPMKEGDDGTIATFICAHEADHAKGINIYGL